MFNRREFLETVVTTSAGSALSSAPAGHESERDLYLGQPLDYWRDALESESIYSPWTVPALSAFGVRSLPAVFAWLEQDWYDVTDVCREAEIAVPVFNRFPRAKQKHQLTRLVCELSLRHPEMVEQLLKRFASERDCPLVHTCLERIVTSIPRVRQFLVDFAKDETVDEWRRATAINLLPRSVVQAVAERSDFAGTSQKLLACSCQLEDPLTLALSLDIPLARKVRLCTSLVAEHGFELAPDAVARLAVLGPAMASLAFRMVTENATAYRSQALELLLEIGSEVVSELLCFADSTEKQTRLLAIQALAHVGTGTESEFLVFRAALGDAFVPIRVAAAIGLIRNRANIPEAIQIVRWSLGQAECLPRWIAMLGLADVPRPLSELDEYLPNRLVDCDEEIGLCACRRVALIRMHTPEIVSVLDRILSKQVRVDGLRREAALELLSAVGGDAVPVAERLLDSRDLTVRCYALRLLTKLGPRARSVAARLASFASTCDAVHLPEVLRANCAILTAAKSLWLIERGLEAFTDFEFCSTAICSIRQLDPSAAADLLPKLTRILERACPELKAIAAQEIAHCGEGWLPAVRNMLHSPQPAVRVGGILALGYGSNDLGAGIDEPLRHALNDDDLAVRFAAKTSVERRLAARSFVS